MVRRNHRPLPPVTANRVTRGPRWPRSQPWPAPLPSSILAPASRPPAAGATRPRPARGGKPPRLPGICFCRSVQATRAGGHWGVTSAPNPDGPPPDRPSRSPAKGGAVRHSGRELPPRFTASGCFPSSQPGGRTAPPIPNARPLPRTQEGCASRASGFLAVGTGITCASRPGVNTP